MITNATKTANIVLAETIHQLDLNNSGEHIRLIVGMAYAEYIAAHPRAPKLNYTDLETVAIRALEWWRSSMRPEPLTW